MWKPGESIFAFRMGAGEAARRLERNIFTKKNLDGKEIITSGEEIQQVEKGKRSVKTKLTKS